MHHCKMAIDVHVSPRYSLRWREWFFYLEAQDFVIDDSRMPNGVS